MGVDVLNPIHLPDLALGVDQIREPPREVFPFVVVGPLGLVRLTYRAIHIGEKRELEVEGLGERFVLLGRVKGDPEDLRPQQVEIGGSVPEPLAFYRSAGGRGLYVPPKRHPLAPQVIQRDEIFVLILQRKWRRLRALFKH